MWDQLRNTPKMKLVLAGFGVITLVGGGVLGSMAISDYEPQPGVSELALHPERQDEIVTQREAQKYQEALGLTQEQTDQIAALLLADRKRRMQDATTELSPQAMMARMGQRAALTKSIRDLLTPDQIEKFNDMPEGRRDQFMQGMGQMTAEERDQFRQMMQERMGGSGPPGFGPNRGFRPGFPGAPRPSNP